MKDQHPARTNSDEYCKLRLASLPAGVSRKASARIVQDLILDRLPRLAGHLLEWPTVTLFNEHYIVKPPLSLSEFRWHRVRESWSSGTHTRTLQTHTCLTHSHSST